MKISSHTIGGVYRDALAVRALSPIQQRDRVNLECDILGKYVVRVAELAGLSPKQKDAR